MFWLDRDRGQPGAEGSASSDGQEPKRQGEAGADPASGKRGPAPHVVISGRQLREEILSYGPAFLEPHRFSEPDAFRALVTVLAAYALGSRTAARLVRERQVADPQWQPPSRREAMQVVSSLNRLRQYLPYLLGQRIQAAAASGSHQQPQIPAYQQPSPGQNSFPSAPPPPQQHAYPSAPPPPPQQQAYPSAAPQPPTQLGYGAAPPPPSGHAYAAAGTSPSQQSYQGAGTSPSHQNYPSAPPPPPQQHYPTATPPPPPPPPAAYQHQVPQPQPHAQGTNYRATEVGLHNPRSNVRAQTPAHLPRQTNNARPQVPRASGVVVRPVISLNRRR